jgi:hypothetical protein
MQEQTKSRVDHRDPRGVGCLRDKTILLRAAGLRNHFDAASRRTVDVIGKRYVAV